MGEAASDYLLNTISLLGLGIGAAGFAITLWVQFRTQRYNAFAYWSAVMMVAVFGTMAADVIHHQLGVSLPARNPQPLGRRNRRMMPVAPWISSTQQRDCVHVWLAQ
jgi:hypothetical protein